MRLKYKLTIIIFLLILLATVANYLLLARSFREIRINRLEDGKVVFSQNLARILVPQLLQRRFDTITSLLKRERELHLHQFDFLAVTDTSGKIVAHTFAQQIPAGIAKKWTPYEKGANFNIHRLTTPQLSVYEISVPIKSRNTRIGTLYTGINSAFLDKAATPLRLASKFSFLIAGILILLGLGLILAVSAAFTSSLSRLKDMAVRLSNGDYHCEVIPTSRDEIGELAQAFEVMRGNIQSARKKLEQHNLDLEAKIYERTKNLAHSNKVFAEQTAQLDAVLSAIPHPMYVINGDCSIAIKNRAAQDNTSFDILSILHCRTSSTDDTYLADEENAPCPLKEVKDTGRVLMLERQFRDGNGGERYFEIHAFPILDRHRKVVQTVLYCVDTTEKRQAADEKLSLEQELNRAQKLEAIGTLAAGIAHEINTPIQFIGDNIGFATEAVSDLFTMIDEYQALLTEQSRLGTPDELRQRSLAIASELDYSFFRHELPEALQHTLDGARSISKIVRAMKDFAYLGGDESITMEDLNKAIESTVIISRSKWKHTARLDTDLDPALPLVPCLILEIKQVILNLILNSVDAIREQFGQDDENISQGHISITTRQKGDKAIITVRDNGAGIPREIQDKVFDHFFTTKEVGKGTGQGLSTAYQVIHDKHGGTIQLCSHPGAGTVFTIILPLHQEDRPDREAAGEQTA